MIYLIYGLIGWLAFSILFFLWAVWRAIRNKPPLDDACNCPRRPPGHGYQPCGCGKSGDPKDPPKQP